MAGLPEEDENFNDELVTVDDDAIAVSAGPSAFVKANKVVMMITRDNEYKINKKWPNYNQLIF